MIQHDIANEVGLCYVNGGKERILMRVLWIIIMAYF